MFKNPGKWTVIVAAVIAVSLFGLTACEKTETHTPVENASTLELYLTDDPADYEAVWIDLQKIMVHLSGDTTGENGWQELPIPSSGRYNLLDLRNGDDTLLVSAELPAGRLSDIRLLLGEENSIVFKNGDSVTLYVPSGDEREVNLEVENASLKPGTPFELVLDFDLARSIFEPGRPDSGHYLLMPDIRVFAKGAGASIQGTVSPDAAKARVLAVSPYNDTLLAIPESLSGFYKFWGIPEGNYTLFFIADSTTGYKNDTLNIQAVKGEVSHPDTVLLHK